MERYFFAYGERSCQHSFIASFCLTGKYGNQVCERNGYMYIMRSLRSSNGERVYLFPHGDTEDREALKNAISEVLNDAHEHGCTVRFETLTTRAKDLTLSLFPDVFTVTANRDYSEYVYSIDKLVNLTGHELASRRKKIHYFFNKYGERFQIVSIEKEHIPEIRSYQHQWLTSRLAETTPQIAGQLIQEDAGIQIALNNFFELGLSGIAAYLDGRLCGYEYGAALSNDCCDAMVQKGDRSLQEIYRVLDWEFLRLCFPKFTWVNWEEDLGVESLRAMKLHYDPDFMIDKFIVCETHNNIE